MLINWAMAFLACTSASTYNEVANVMILPHISTIYQKTAELISTKNDKANCLHMNTICRSISDRACCENWTSDQQIGAIAQDSAKINSEIKHDYVASSNNSNQNLMRGKVPINMQMIREIWLKCNGAFRVLNSHLGTSIKMLILA
jgi:hypothetical protein